MINFVEGKIHFDEKIIRAGSDSENLNALAVEGLIEKRQDDSGQTYYYVEAAADGMRFEVLIGLQDQWIDWLRLQWVDSLIHGWDDFSEEALRAEYRLLWNFIKKTVGRQPDLKKNGKRAWRFKWGQVEVCYEPRAALAGILMVPRRGRS